MPVDAATLQAAIRVGNNSQDPDDHRAMFTALLDSLLIVQTGAPVAPEGGPHVVADDTPIDVASMIGPGGERALPVFTDLDALRRWHPDAEHHLAMGAADLFRKAIDWGFDVVLVDHGSEDWIQLRDELLATLAAGRVPEH